MRIITNYIMFTSLAVIKIVISSGMAASSEIALGVIVVTEERCGFDISGSIDLTITVSSLGNISFVFFGKYQ